MNALLDRLKPGMTVVDVGANVGSYTKPFLEAVGPTGRVYAIEPGLHTLPYLTAHAPEAVVIHAAVGDHNGMTILYHSNESCHHSMYPANLVGNMQTSEPVRVVTLDGLIATGELPRRIDAVKVDAQGAEMAILLGARRLLRAQRHTLWYLEVWPHGLKRAGSSADELCDHLAALRYAPVGRSWDDIRQEAGRTTNEHGSLDILVGAA